MEKSQTDKVIIFENNEGVYDNKSSLQDNFKQFLKMRKDLRKSQLNTQPTIDQMINRSSFRDNPERMEMLRNKFVEKAITYLGVPYGKRYLDETNPLYNSPIFLDCCALVRQCVNDLNEDFGFMLGRWNQAYQMDTLPEKIPFSELKRGDLIFYEGINNPEKGWKQQPHNLVHVEIFLGGEGTPERTIAARERFGVVEYNETYQFTSENYSDIKYYFRSIDTWLRGIHKSFCDEHKWHDQLLDNVPNKFSLFKVEDEVPEYAEEFEKKI